MDEREYDEHTSPARVERIVQTIIRNHLAERDGNVSEQRIIIIMNLIRMMNNKGFQEVA